MSGKVKGYTVRLVPVYVTPRTHGKYDPPYPKGLLHRDEMEATEYLIDKVPCERMLEMAVRGARQERVYLGVEAYREGKRISAVVDRAVNSQWPKRIRSGDIIEVSVKYEDTGLTTVSSWTE